MKRFAVVLAVLLLVCTADVFSQGRWAPNILARQLTLRPVALASAAGALTLTTPGSFFVVSGTETVTSIVTSANDAGRIIFLQTSGNCTFTDGSNLKLASSFSASADDVLTLISDGTNWYEIDRSAN